jgi:hypothetical protein
MTKSRGIGRGGRRPNQTGRPRKVVAPAAPAAPFDPRAVLRAIAADPLAPATARVQAARALLPSAPATARPEAQDPITMAALRLLNVRNR